MVAAFLGGWGPGALAVGLSALAAGYFFVPPFFSFAMSLGDAIALAAFVAVCGIMVGLITLLNEAVDRLSAHEENTRTVIETAPAGMIAVDEDGIITLVNSTAEKLFGYKRSELIGANFDILVPGRFRAEHSSYARAYMAQPVARLMGVGRDLFALQKGGSEIPVEIGLSPLVRERRHGALATVIDISERKAAQRRQEVLVHEVQHRAKNVLASVQAIAMRTIRDDRDRESFVSKLQALARTQELFFKGSEACLNDIVRGEMDSFADQVIIEGSEVSLTPGLAQDLTLIVHELATNAVKHGALSAPSGKVLIRWSTEGKQLAFDWIEDGGPPAVEPTRKGFGHVILNDVAHGFGAQVATEYLSSGLRYRLTVALDRSQRDAEVQIASARSR
jgi:PAS domain S-box-containing protein